MLNLAMALLQGRDATTVRAFEDFLRPELLDVDAVFDTPPVDGVDLVGPPTTYGDVGIPPLDTTVLVVRRTPVTAELMAGLPLLRHVQKLGDRADTVDLVWAAANGITVECVPRPSLEATAEHTVLLMLALVHGLRAADRAARTPSDAGSTEPGYNWAGLAEFGTLQGRTVGLIGLGEVGVRVARRLCALGAQVHYWSRTRHSPEVERQLGVTWRNRNQLLAESDLISLHVPGTPANRALVDSDFLRRMRPDAYLVNVARGSLIDEAALVRALRERRIRGAALDVHAKEPRPPSDPMLAMEDVILTPHIAGGLRSHTLAEIRTVAQGVIRSLNSVREGRS
ncbi:NAD(P)-dependent oxidoreductase [Nocardia sp. NPDC047038]|uniref:2-hydroxyacid dehydrogenase n=1 Tax=Nocardia sp. NPDC047038 TaxID=3154338 RepID=UPI0033D069DF